MPARALMRSSSWLTSSSTWVSSPYWSASTFTTKSTLFAVAKLSNCTRRQRDHFHTVERQRQSQTRVTTRLQCDVMEMRSQTRMRLLWAISMRVNPSSADATDTPPSLSLTSKRVSDLSLLQKH